MLTAPRVTTTSGQPAVSGRASHSCTAASTRRTSAETARGVSAPADTSVAVRQSTTTARAPSVSSGKATPSAHSTSRAGWTAEGATGTHSTPSIPSSPREAVASCSGVTSRMVRVSTEMTGAPAVSAMATATASAAVRVSRTRSAEPPTACSRTPDQANGRMISPLENA